MPIRRPGPNEHPGGIISEINKHPGRNKCTYLHLNSKFSLNSRFENFEKSTLKFVLLRYFSKSINILLPIRMYWEKNCQKCPGQQFFPIFMKHCQNEYLMNR